MMQINDEAIYYAIKLLGEDRDFNRKLAELVDKHLKRFASFGIHLDEEDADKYDTVVVHVVETMLADGWTNQG